MEFKRKSIKQHKDLLLDPRYHNRKEISTKRTKKEKQQVKDFKEELKELYENVPIHGDHSQK